MAKGCKDFLPDSLLPHWPGVVFRQRLDLSFEFATPRLEEISGCELERWDRESDLFYQVLHELDVEEFRRRLRRMGKVTGGLNHSFRLRHLSSGRVTYVSEYRQGRFDASGQLVGYEGFWLDVTRHTLSERRLAAAAWKETLGLLTLGLAHDFNNLLAGIQGLSDSFLSQIQPDHAFHEGLTLLRRNTQKATQLVRQIAELHRVRGGVRSYRDLNEALTSGVELLRKIVPRRVDVTAELCEGPVPVYLDTVEFEQILINLALNSVESMSEGGVLSLRTRQDAEFTVPEQFVGVRPRPPVVSLAVSDTGGGIEPRLVPYLFDPFFTTKPMNRGSGLGLYNVRLFVEKHHGGISVDAKEGSGATFRLWLPVADFTEADEILPSASGPRRRRLLLAGQPGRLFDSTAEFLRQLEYHVTEGRGDAEALLRSGECEPDGVFILVEPGDRGTGALIQFVAQQRPALKVVVKTVGCNPDEVGSEWLAGADLVLSAEVSEEGIPEKLAAVFDLTSRSITDPPK